MTRVKQTGTIVAVASLFLLAACTTKPGGPLGASQQLTAEEIAQSGSAASGNVVAGSLEDLTRNIGTLVFFTTGSAQLSTESREILNRQAAWLKTYANTNVRIEGHADERGTREYNLSLSTSRAATVRDYLINQGVDGRRIAKIAYGKERPVEVCQAARCWDRNRRAETVLTSSN